MYSKLAFSCIDDGDTNNKEMDANNSNLYGREKMETNTIK
jgi:hypothetical protein